jgi:hypothetical protein
MLRTACGRVVTCPGCSGEGSDLDGLIAALRADGLASLEFEWLDGLVRVPLLLRPIVGRPGILYGVK